MNELSGFSRYKKEINLTQYAATLGYEIDRKKSTRSCVAMRKGGEDKVIVSRKNGHWLYFSVYDDADKGSIIDFIKNRTGQPLYEIGLELDQWLDGMVLPPTEIPYTVEEKKPEPGRIKCLFNRCHPVTSLPYLENRGIGKEALLSRRFHRTVYSDYYQNAVFPHFRDGSVCGLELKGHNTSLFVRGSEKTLWQSNIFDSDDTMVIAEAAIDAISYHILFSLQNAFYTATSGGFSPLQEAAITSLLRQKPDIKTLVLAVDNNQGGDRLYNRLFQTIHDAGFTGAIQRHSPEIAGQDWNDVLQPGRL